MSEKKKINPKSMGIIFIIISAFSFACMALFVNMSGDMPVFQKAFFRNCVAIVLSLGLLIRSKDKFKIKKGSLKYLLLRASFGTLGILFNFYAISHINLADAQILNKLSPFFAIIASIFILKEVANRRQWICVIVAFIGALFVVKPTGLSDPEHLFPAIIGLCGGCVSGTAYTFMRKLSLHGERSEVIVAFFSVFSCIVLIPFVILTYEPITTKQLICLLLAGTCACSGQIFITSAYARCPAKEISIYDYSSVIFAAILGFLFLGQKPDIFSFIGYLIIISASVYSYIHNVRKQQTVS